MRYYIFCPAYVKTGGPELAHQMCHVLNENGIEAYMYYTTPYLKEPQDVSAVDAYLKYNTRHVTDINEVEQEDSVAIINESSTYLVPLLKKCLRVVWWMSVDNYIINSGEGDIDCLKKNVDYHLVQSEYAREYVRRRIACSESCILSVSDYTNDTYLQLMVPAKYRQNIGLYNPRKGFEDFAPLMNYTQGVRWIPITNLSAEEIFVLMQSAKVYVDFGHHPGKDRIPREAASCGCCVITNKKGAAAFREDIPIAEKYKFGDVRSSYAEIATLVQDICNNYESHLNNFKEYRKWIAEEKCRFIHEVLTMNEILSENAYRTNAGL